MGLVGRRTDATLAVATAAVLATGVVVADLGAAPQRAAAAVRPAAVRPGATGIAPHLQAAATSSSIDSQLSSAIRYRMSHATAAGYGVVVDVQGKGRVVSIRPDTRIRPASTQKLFTTLPLLLANPDRRLVTEIRASGNVVNGVLDGNLVVKSAADPSLLFRDLKSLSRQVSASGIRKVTGSLRLDIGSLPLATRRSGWQPGSVPYDVGPLSPFPVYEDVSSRSSSYLRNPTAANLDALRVRLGGAGVHIVGGSQIVRKSTATRVVATHESAPMSDLIRHTLQESDNLYAETLLSIEKRWRVNRMLSNVGLSNSYATDGSGLSYSDYETARGEVNLLKYAAASNVADLLVSSLPVGCRTGTLVDRFCKTIGAGMVWAKTGTLRYNRALAGYTYDAQGRRVTFSILTYGVNNLTASARAIDGAVLAMRRYAN